MQFIIRLYRSEKNLKKVLTNPARFDIITLLPPKIEYEGIAQLVEHLLDVQGVIGSSPIILTKSKGQKRYRPAKARKQSVCGHFLFFGAMVLRR